MKKLGCALTFMCLASGVNAQLLGHYGLKVAYTSAAQSFNYYGGGFEINDERRPGVNAAAFAEWSTIPNLSVVTQLEYTQRGKGVKFARTTNDPTVLDTWVQYHRVDYLSVPILAKLSLASGLVQPYLIAGPRVDFVLANHGADPNFRSLYDDFKSPNLGGSAGAGMSTTAIVPAEIFVEFRYNLDLTAPYDNGALRVRNNAYDIWLGVAL